MKLSNAKKYVVMGAAAISLFGLGTFTEAQNDFVGTLINDAKKEVSGAAYYKKEDLINNMNERVGDSLKNGIQSDIDEKKQLVETALQTYFDEKAGSITDTPEFQEAIDSELSGEAQIVIERYQNEIDQAFADMMGIN